MEEVLFLKRKASASQSDIAVTTGVFVGCMYQEYLQLQYSHGCNITASLITGNGLSYLPARISYTFNFKGPSVGADTACSSSLVSLHEGAHSIQQDAVHNSVVSGVNGIILSSTTISICQMGALSDSARCKTFDSAADGYGRGEGVVSMLLAESDAQHQGIALLRSSLINQDGRSNGITAPNGKSQSELIIRSVEIAGDGVYALHSCHGTGTELGDPIEVSAMLKAISRATSPQLYKLTVASSKSILGHTEGAAGLTGLLLCAESLSARTSSAVANLRMINPYVSSILNSNGSPEFTHVTKGSTGRVQVQYEIFGTSSFGMGGTNAHASISHLHEMDEVRSRTNDFKILLSHQKYWPVFPVSLHMKFCRRMPQRVSFSLRMLKPNVAYLVDHIVQGRSLVPGALWIDIGLCCFATNISKTSSEIGIRNLLFRAPQILSEKDLISVLAANVDLRSGELTMNETGNTNRLFFEATCSPIGNTIGKNIQPKIGYSNLSNSVSAFESPKAIALVETSMPDGHMIHPAELDSHFHLLAALSKETAASIPTQLDFFMAINSKYANITENSRSISAQVETSGSAPLSNIVGISQIQAVLLRGLRSASLAGSATKTKSPIFFRNMSKSDAQMGHNQFYSIEHQVDDLATDEGTKFIGSTYITINNVNVRMESNKIPPKACIHHITLVAQLLPAESMRLELHARNSFQITPPIQGAVDIQERSLWGLYRTLKSESRQNLDLICVQADNASKYAPRAMGKDGADGYAHNAGATFRPLLVNSTFRNGINKPRSYSKQASIVLGGTDGIGLLTFRYQSIRLRSSFTLVTGRTGRLKKSQSVADGTLLKSDMSFTEDLEEIIKSREVFCSIVHSGGLNDDKAIGGQNPHRIRRVFAPKCASLNSLSRIFKLTPTSDSYFFSSISSLIGSPGQSNYASANYYLEGQGINLKNSGCHVTSIAWGAWSGIGMAKFRPEVLKKTLKYGLGVLSPISGLASLDHLASSGKISKVIITSPFNFDGDFWRNNSLLESRERNHTSGKRTIINDSREIRRESVATVVLQVVTGLLGKDISVTDPLMSAGVDSLAAIELHDSLASAFNITLPNTLIFDHPTVDAISTYILSIGSEEQMQLETSNYVQIDREENRSIHISSIASRIPFGEGGNHSTFEVLQAQSECQSMTPFERWDADSLYSISSGEGIYARFGAFLSSVSYFDNELFGINALQATYIDPQQRLLMHAAYTAISQCRGLASNDLGWLRN